MKRAKRDILIYILVHTYIHSDLPSDQVIIISSILKVKSVTLLELLLGIPVIPWYRNTVKKVHTGTNDIKILLFGLGFYQNTKISSVYRNTINTGIQ